MRLTYLRCGICDAWARPERACKNCGAHRVAIKAEPVKFYNYKLVEMVRGIPRVRIVEHIINR